MGRLRWIGSMVLVAAVVASLVFLDPLGGLGGEGDTGAAVVREQAEIAVTTLSTTNEADGSLNVTERRPVVAVSPGTVTSVVPAGTGIEPGAELFTIDESPTVALPGTTPAWRAMTVDDVGADVAQLETALVALGYDPDGELTVDDTYTTVTASIVERWQEDAGLEVTGTVAPGSVVFVPDDAGVSSVETAVGQAATPGATIVVLSSTLRQLTVDVAADQLSTVDVGSALSARLPDRSTVDATVSDIVPSGDGSWIVTARLVEAQTPLPEGEAVPVTVSWSEVIAEQATTVGAGALTRLDTGAYAVEVVESDGTTRFVQVEVGNTSGSTVELITDLAPGTPVISP